MREEPIGRVDRDEGDLEVIAKSPHHLLALVLSHQSVIHEHACQPVSDRAVHQQGGDARVDAAGEPADRAPVANLRPDALDLLLHHRARAPAQLAAANPLQKVPEDLLAVGGVDHLRVELDPVDAALRGLECRHRRSRRGRERLESRRCREHGVAVRHPAGLLPRRAVQQATGLAHGQLGASELSHLGALHPSPELARQQLHEAGPPERITPFGRRRDTSSAPTWCGRSSENTPHSLTRRAISCEY